MYTKIDQYYNDRKLGWGFNDKNYYSRIFPEVKQPTTLVRKIKGVILDERYQQISVKDAISLICAEDEVICKPTLETGSGRNIRFWKTKENKQEILTFLQDSEQADYIVQGLVKQHSEMERIHAGSLNTIRITSLLMEDGVHILSSVLRMGVNDSRVDNATAGGEGMTCGIMANGEISEFARGYYTGEKFERHPQGFVFKGFVIPGFQKAIDTIKKVAPSIAHFKLVSWDIAIDENEEPVLIEANMRKGSINFHQFNNGPMFGDLTDRVLEEVFGRK